MKASYGSCEAVSALAGHVGGVYVFVGGLGFIESSALDSLGFQALLQGMRKCWGSSWELQAQLGLRATGFVSPALKFKIVQGFRD